MLRLSLATSALGLCLSAWAAPQLSPQPVQAPAGLSAIASTPVARSLPGESGLAYQWPGAYFELNFEGNSAYFQLGEGAAIMRVSVDGQALPLLTKPAAGVYAVSELAPGTHALRLEVLTEHQAGPNGFGGFLLPADAKALPVPPRARRIEFIGDSHTVGYGNTSSSRDCTQDEVWATTDNTLAYGKNRKILPEYFRNENLTAKILC